MRNWLLTLTTILTLVDGCLMTGCSSTPKTAEQHQQGIDTLHESLAALESARAKGRFQFRHGGSPFQAWMKNENAVGLGSNAMNIEVDVDLDFTQSPRTKPPVDPALHASLPADMRDLIAEYDALPPNAATMREIERLRNEMLLRLGETQADGR